MVSDSSFFDFAKSSFANLTNSLRLCFNILNILAALPTFFRIVCIALLELYLLCYYCSYAPIFRPYICPMYFFYRQVTLSTIYQVNSQEVAGSALVALKLENLRTKLRWAEIYVMRMDAIFSLNGAKSIHICSPSIAVLHILLITSW